MSLDVATFDFTAVDDRSCIDWPQTTCLGTFTWTIEKADHYRHLTKTLASKFSSKILNRPPRGILQTLSIGEVFNWVPSHDHLREEKQVRTSIACMLGVLLYQLDIARNLPERWVDLGECNPKLSQCD
jgi:hypothetical protein